MKSFDLPPVLIPALASNSSSPPSTNPSANNGPFPTLPYTGFNSNHSNNVNNLSNNPPYPLLSSNNDVNMVNEPPQPYPNSSNNYTMSYKSTNIINSVNNWNQNGNLNSNAPNRANVPSCAIEGPFRSVDNLPQNVDYFGDQDSDGKSVFLFLLFPFLFPFL